MPSPVHILLTIRNPALTEMAMLVFRTLRLGFPTAPVYVWGNGLTPPQCALAAKECALAAATFNNVKACSHDAWIEQLVLNQAQPFWICDTDMVFFAEVEWFCAPEDDVHMAGRYEPAWIEPWMDVERAARLHTCLLWLNPGRLRGEMMRWMRKRVPEVFIDMHTPWIRQTLIPRHKQRSLFYDTLAGVWQALGGVKFTARQDEAFSHLNCGTYSDALKGCADLKDLAIAHQAILADPELARGIKTQQDEFYQQRAVTPQRKEKHVKSRS